MSQARQSVKVVPAEKRLVPGHHHALPVLPVGNVSRVVPRHHVQLESSATAIADVR